MPRARRDLNPTKSSSSFNLLPNINLQCFTPKTVCVRHSDPYSLKKEFYVSEMSINPGPLLQSAQAELV